METKKSNEKPMVTAASGDANLEPAKVTVPEVVAESLAAWAARINDSLIEGVAAFVQVGRDLVEAKQKLVHGEFQRLFEPGVLRVDQRTAQMLVRIAENPSLSNANNHSHLPAALNPLYQLSRIDGGRLQKAIDEGKVSVVTTIKEAKALAGKWAKTPKYSTINVAINLEPALVTQSNESALIDENAADLQSALEQYLSDYPSRTREILRSHPQAASKIEANAALVLALIQEHRTMEDAVFETLENPCVPIEEEAEL